MKSLICASILALSLFGLASLASAQTSGSAAGSFRFAGDDGMAKFIEFKSAINADGTTSGKMTFSGPVEIPDQDVDGTGSKAFSGKLDNLYIEVEFDSMTVERNRAVMSGIVTVCNVEDYLKQRVLLVVEDNGYSPDNKETDKVTWGFYKPSEINWVPSDAELEDDKGASMVWLATDAERKDDVGVWSNQSKEITSKSFPLESYSLNDVQYGDGDIQVQQ